MSVQEESVMSKQEQIKFIESVWNYLDQMMIAAYAVPDKGLFDWYLNGQQTFRHSLIVSESRPGQE